MKEKIKVKDLILILEKLDPNLIVVSSGFRGCSDWLRGLDETDIEIVKENVNYYEDEKDKCKKMKCLVIG